MIKILKILIDMMSEELSSEHSEQEEKLVVNVKQFLKMAANAPDVPRMVHAHDRSQNKLSLMQFLISIQADLP